MFELSRDELITDFAQEWMRTDYAEERRWKIIEAREFAYHVVEWHLSRPRERAQLMVGGRGWGECNEVPVPGHYGRMREKDVPAESAEDDVEMLVGQADAEEAEGTAERGFGMDATGAEVLKNILANLADEGLDAARGAGKANAVKEEQAEDDDAMGEEVDAEGEEDAQGEPENAAVPADVDAEGEADGEMDAEGEMDVDDQPAGSGQGVIGLEGKTFTVQLADN